MWLLLACVPDPLSCGPGTHRVGDECRPDATDSAPPDTGETDDSAPPDTGETDDSAPPDTGETDDTAPPDTGDDLPVSVWILAGQSNMDGYAYASGLPPAWRTAAPEIPLHWSGWGTFRALEPASYGGGYLAGPEVAMGHTLAAAGGRVALVKHAVGGTDLATYWNPGATPDHPAAGPGWRDLVTTLDAAAAELDAAGEPWRWAGLAWMQGESDAAYAETAAAYEANLTRFVARLREEVGEPSLPVALGLVACDGLCVHVDTVRAAQTAVADADPAVVAFETRDLARNPYDAWHYDGPSNRVLGERFAQALTGAPLSPAPVAALRVVSHTLGGDDTGTVGWTFTLDRAVTLTDIGAFTPPGSFVWSGTEVGIWDARTAALLHRTVVPSRYEAPTSYRDGFWYVAVDPVTLPAGEYVIGLVSWQGDLDRYAESATATVGDALTVGQAAWGAGYWLGYPGERGAVDGVGRLGPGFLYRE